MRLRVNFQGLILGGCLLVVLCTLIFVAVILERSFRDDMVRQLQASLRQQLVLTQQIVRDEWPAGGAAAEVDALADRLGRRLGLRVTLIDPGGRVLGDSQVPLNRLPSLDDHSHRPEVLAARRQGVGYSIRHSHTIGSDLMYVAGVIELPAGRRLLVRLAMPLSELDKAVARNRRLVLWALFLGVLLSLGAAYLVARAISRPVRQLTQAARAIAAGDLSHRLRRYPSHEMGELARAFDTMADTIQEKIWAVTRAKEHLEAVLGGMSEGVLVTDRQGRIMLANQVLVELLGLKQDPVGRSPSEILRNADLVEAIRRVRRGEHQVSREIRLLEPVPRHLEVQVVGLSPRAGEPGCVAVLRDITERKRIDQVRRDFVANVSHELRTPLTAIKGSAETLLEGALESPPDARRFVEVIQRQARRLEALVADLLELARIEAGRAGATERQESFSVGALAESLVATVGPQAGEKGVELAVELEEPALALTLPRRDLEQAVLNLLDNAIKYTDSGGRVRLRLGQDGARLVVEVSDTGVGIPAEHQERVFERFYRVDKDRSRRLGGTGLGLAIVKHLAQSLGGRVTVQSRPGRGSTFRLEIPLPPPAGEGGLGGEQNPPGGLTGAAPAGK